jgi:hypothetical protein
MGNRHPAIKPSSARRLSRAPAVALCLYAGISGSMPMTRNEALDLQTMVNKILNHAIGKRNEIGGAVNWADLFCTDVAISLIDDVVTVTIEEAAPDAKALREFVSKELTRMGHHIRVQTEW